MADHARQIAGAQKIKQQDQAFRLLQTSFVLVPLIAGIDKYFHLLTNWEQFLSPMAMNVLGPRGTHVFMLADGALEILLGLGVLIRPRIFSYIVSAWLLGIVINLLTTGHYLDIALRDAGLSLSALALGRLASARTSSL